MKVQKFTGNTMRDALLEVTKELGKEAIILQSRKVTEGGLMGLGTRNLVEVTAALDKDLPISNRFHRTDTPGFNPAVPIAPVNDEQYKKQELRLVGLTNQVESLQSTLLEMSNRLQYPDTPALPDPFGVYYTKMANSGMELDTISKVLIKSYESMGGKDLADIPAIERRIKANIAKLLKTKAPKKLKVKEPYKTVVIGPTGVGKTTTIAKLAASARLYKKLNVALITTDTFRIAATDQLRAFADILKIPMEVVYSDSEMRKAVRIHAEKDAIFIDTTGRSPEDANNITDLLKIVSSANPHHIHMVLSSSTDKDSQYRALKGFGKMNIDSLIFTKLDESAKPGSIIDVASESRKPISYLTNGQNVPQDIKVWNLNGFVDGIIKA